MSVLVVAIVLGVVLGYVFGGKVGNVRRLRFRWWGLGILALGVQLLPLPTGTATSDTVVRTAFLFVSLASLLMFVLLNLRTPAMALVAIGLVANAIVVTANGKMPVTRDALRASGHAALVRDAELLGNDRYELSSTDDTFVFLADTIGIPPPFGVVMSIGDLFIFGGLVLLMAEVMQKQTPLRVDHHRSSRADPDGS
jgi:hypothetical protein